MECTFLECTIKDVKCLNKQMCTKLLHEVCAVYIWSLFNQNDPLSI
ncbi:hypothetical protein MCHI_004114 [Candidatus Magnetoovum chiemensis]|nr:hypothetical protein MCHI_004114 [Candidatus Magnetoovum chiemensis]